MRCMKRVDGKWLKEDPPDITRWLWQHDGGEAVVVDDGTSTYYCSQPEIADTYRAAWEKERKVGDKRTVAMFYDLGKMLHKRTPPDDGKNSPNYCTATGKDTWCSERAECGGNLKCGKGAT